MTSLTVLGAVVGRVPRVSFFCEVSPLAFGRKFKWLDAIGGVVLLFRGRRLVAITPLAMMTCTHGFALVTVTRKHFLVECQARELLFLEFVIDRSALLPRCSNFV